MLKVLFLADIHYIGKAEHVCSISDRKASSGLSLINEILDRNKDMELVILMGDLVDNGEAPYAADDLREISETFRKASLPVIVVPGNHDCSKDLMFEIFGDKEGVHEVKGHTFVSFADKYNEDNTASRDFTTMKKFFEDAGGDDPIIVLQHNPVYPIIEKDYPYNINDKDMIMNEYTDRQVLLSVSGHAHWGIDVLKKEGVSYFTCPALCEEPFRYVTAEFEQDRFDIKMRSLK